MASAAEALVQIVSEPASGRATPKPHCPEGLNGAACPHANGDVEELVCPFPHANGTALANGDLDSSPKTQIPPAPQQAPPAPPPATTAGETMQEIDPDLIRVSLDDRVRYLKDFVGFTARDVAAITTAAAVVAPIVNDTVERLYANLFEFDITKKVFMERNEGFVGEMPRRLEDLKLDGPQLTYRKVFMRTWCRRVLTGDYSSGKIWAYMDKVGVMHTGAKAFKHRNGVPPLHVPYRDCALTLGWVQTVLHTAILSTPEDRLSMEQKIAAVAAFNKVLWIQNDLFARHYIPNE